MIEEKGITLVALIITIIVLLILAVVAINAVTGDGIIQHATEAKTEYGKAQQIEEIQLALNEWSLLKNIPNNQETLVGFLNGKLENYDVEGSTDGSAKITLDNREIYKATEQGKLIKMIKFSVDYVDGTTTTSSFEFYAEEGMTWEQFVESSYNKLEIENVVYSFQINSETLNFRETTSVSGGSGGSSSQVENVEINDVIENNQRIVFEIL